MSSASPGRLPGLDGLRALAVLLVVFFHQEVLGIGWIGVQIFFVLSGFLITRILVQSKELPLSEFLIEFYGRRSLRIFPLYFGVLGALAVLVALGLEAQGVREGLPFAATYTYNFWHASDSFIHSKLISHFWSLCVEEQFYLVWPFVIFFCRPRALKALLLSIVVLGPLLRFGLHELLQSPSLGVFRDLEVALYVLTPSHVDAFSLGAFFSLYPLGGAPRALFGSFAALALLGAWVAPQVPEEFPVGTFGYPLGLRPGHGYIWAYSLLNLCAALTIDCVVHRRFLPALFESKILSYIGKISYGVYVFHRPLESLVYKVLPNAPVAIALMVQVVLTLLVASISFYFWETPFLRKKDVWFQSAHPVKEVAGRVPA
jgi:peptidoglycan/LPS O-acetylase OafA/YrhL